MSEQVMKVVETIGKPGVVGVTGAGMYGLMYGFGGSAPVMGVNINGALLFGAVAGLASLGGTATKNYVVPLVTNNPWGEQLVMVAQPVGTGVATTLLSIGVASASGGSVGRDGMTTAFLMGAASEMIGDYVWDTVALGASAK